MNKKVAIIATLICAVIIALVPLMAKKPVEDIKDVTKHSAQYQSKIFKELEASFSPEKKSIIVYVKLKEKPNKDQWKELKQQTLQFAGAVFAQKRKYDFIEINIINKKDYYHFIRIGREELKGVKFTNIDIAEKFYDSKVDDLTKKKKGKK